MHFNSTLKIENQFMIQLIQLQQGVSAQSFYLAILFPQSLLE